jgi:MFS family permease
MSCFLGLSLIGIFDDEKHLYLGVFLLSIASGTVITCLTSLASFGKEDEKGMRLGMFRSSGQLGRAIGPLFTCSLYWVYGKIVYFWGGFFMLNLLLLTALLFTNRTISKIKKD